VSHPILATPYCLPYRVQLSEAPLFSSGGTVTLRLIPVHTPDDAAVADFDGLVTSFCLLASTGAISDDSNQQVDASFDWSLPVVVGREIVWHFSNCRFQEQAAVLLSQLFLLCHEVHPLSILHMTGVGISRALAFDPSLEDPFPRFSRAVPFALHVDPDIFDSVLLTVRFDCILTNDEQSQIEGCVLDWAVATAMGAYGVAPVPPRQCGVTLEQHVTFLGDELEFPLLHFRAHRAALRGLVNVFIKLHQRGVQIRELILE
jgi:hypothetical protein